MSKRAAGAMIAKHREAYSTSGAWKMWKGLNEKEEGKQRDEAIEELRERAGPVEAKPTRILYGKE